MTLVATFGIERSITAVAHRPKAPVAFRESLADAWADRDARLFTIFVFVSMLAYSAQDLILEPYGGLVFGMSRARRRALRAFSMAAFSPA